MVAELGRSEALLLHGELKNERDENSRLKGEIEDLKAALEELRSGKG